jgi:DNA repair exonuclease SbcCD nuclease subunit
MRVAVAADLHVKLAGPRAAEAERCMSWLRDDLIAQRPDLVVIAGDFYHQRATPAEERYAQEWLRAVVAGAGCDVLIVRGNHDDGDQLDVLGATATTGGKVIACRHPVAHGARGVHVSLLPWPELGRLAAVLPSASIAERREAAHAALVDILRGCQPNHASTPHLLVCHAAIAGAACDSGQPIVGSDELAVTTSDLMEARPDVVLCGHIHAAQQMVAPVPVHYVGSLFRGSFGEAIGDKGYTIAEWDGSGWELTRRESPARRMLLVECRWTGGDDAHLDGDEVDPEECQDAEIRLRVEFASDEREAARAAAAGVRRTLEEAGAFSVTVEERPVVVQRTRCSEIAAARTTAEKVEQWAKAAGLEVPEGAGGKLAALEEEVARA